MEQQPVAASVILVHGLWMTGVELRCLGGRLERCGFNVRYFRYKSWRGSLERAAAELRRFAEQQSDCTVHLLGHSLGGLVIAAMLESGDPGNPGKVVLLGSPQQGSVLAASLARCRVGRFLLGPFACAAIVRNRPLFPVGRELLVIAGTFSFGFARFFGVAVPNDGTVAVVETQVPGAPVQQVRASHMGMLFSRATLVGIVNFLRC
jgi:pimeloyl-ACP methyl ester carboxylesterase